MNKLQRNTSIELMRLMSMVMIVIHHIVGQGIGFQFYCMGGDYIANWYPIVFIEGFCIVGVNLFLLISGYYGIKLRMAGLLKFLAIVLGFVSLHSVSEIIYNNEVTLKHLLRSFLFFFSENTAWFVKSYFLLMLSTFIINPALEKLDKKQILTLVGIVLYINVYLGFFKHWKINENGYTVSHMIMMYIIGYAIRLFKIPPALKKHSFLFGYLFLSILLGIILCLCLGRTTKITEFWLLSYNNPITMLGSISLFCFFLKYKFCNSKLNYILSGVFGIYLFHQYYPFWSQIMMPNIRENFIQMSLGYFLLYCLGLILFIVIMGIVINLAIIAIVNRIMRNKVISQILITGDTKLGLR